MQRVDDIQGSRIPQLGPGVIFARHWLGRGNLGLQVATGSEGLSGSLGVMTKQRRMNGQAGAKTPEFRGAFSPAEEMEKNLTG